MRLLVRGGAVKPVIHIYDVIGAIVGWEFTSHLEAYYFVVWRCYKFLVRPFCWSYQIFSACGLIWTKRIIPDIRKYRSLECSRDTVI